MCKSLLLVFLGFFGLLAVSACQAVEGRVDIHPQPTLTATDLVFESEQGDEGPVAITLEPVTITPTPFITPLPEFNVEGINCEDTFCQVPWRGWLERPVGEGYTRIIDRSYPYGSTAEGAYDLHHGVEFLNKYGTPVLAAQDGEVVFAGMDDVTKIGPFRWFYGNVVLLRHSDLLFDDEVYTLYAHLSEIRVEVGDQVTVGEQIGNIGASGAAYGPHLHFETRVGSNDYAHTVNPVLWFAPLDQGDHQETTMLAGLILDRGGNPVSKFPLTLEKIGETGEVEAYYYPHTYYPTGVNEHPLVGENFVVPDIPAGNYRLAFISGRLYEIFFTLDPGSLGFVKVQLD